MHNLKSNFDRIKPIVKKSLSKFIDSNGNIKKVDAKPIPELFTAENIPMGYP